MPPAALFSTLLTSALPGRGFCSFLLQASSVFSIVARPLSLSCAICFHRLFYYCICFLTFCVLFQLSASSAALDLALSPSPGPEKSNSWNRVNRHRHQQSMSAINGSSSSKSNEVTTIGSRPQSLRHSLDLKYISESSAEPSSVAMSPQNSHMASPPRLQSSFSANDVPTVKSPSGSSIMSGNANNHAQQHFHNHNASMGRIPAGVMPPRHTRELSSDNSMNAGREQPNGFQSIQSALQASAAPFGPSLTSAPQISSAMSVSGPSTTAPTNSFNNFYSPGGFGPNASNPNGNFGMPLITSGMQQMNMNGANGGSMYSPQNFTGYGSMPYNQGAGQPRDSQARVIQHRRQLDNEGKQFTLVKVFTTPWLTISPQPCLATRICLLNPSEDRSMNCVRTSMAVAIFKRSWRNAMPTRFI